MRLAVLKWQIQYKIFQLLFIWRPVSTACLLQGLCGWIILKKRTNGASLWFVPHLLIGLLRRTGAHGQHDGPSLGCGDGDDHHSGQYHDIHLKENGRIEKWEEANAKWQREEHRRGALTWDRRENTNQDIEENTRKKDHFSLHVMIKFNFLTMMMKMTGPAKPQITPFWTLSQQ